MYISRARQTDRVAGDFLSRKSKNPPKAAPIQGSMTFCPKKVDFYEF